MCVSIRHPECQVGQTLLVLGMTFSFQPTCALFLLPLDCFFLCGLQTGGDAHGPYQHVILHSDRSPTHGHFCFFSLLKTQIFLSDTHSQYEHTEESLTNKCNMLGKSCLN